MHGHNRSVGVLGPTTREKALACLQNCPLLADMAEWSHWDLVFKPQLKDLKDFIQKHGFAYSCNVLGEMSSNFYIMLTARLLFPANLDDGTGQRRPPVPCNRFPQSPWDFIDGWWE